MTQFESQTMEQALYVIEQIADQKSVSYVELSTIRNRLQHVIVADNQKKIKKALTKRITK